MEQMCIDFTAANTDGGRLEGRLTEADFCGSAEEISAADIAVEALWSKSGADSYVLEVKVGGTLSVPCDRCLDPVEVEVKASAPFIVKIAYSAAADDDTVIAVAPEEPTLDLAPIARELAQLNIPIRHVHAPGNCNHAMTDLLQKYAATRSGEGNDSQADPRWKGLENITIN